MGEVKTKFELPVGKVTIKYIKRNKGMAAAVGDGHVISGNMLDTAYRQFPVPKLRNGSLKNPLTKEEKEFFEEGRYRGTNLSIYSDFWKEFTVKLFKHDTVLDLENPEDYLSYKVLLAWDQVVAPDLHTYKTINRPSYMYVMVAEGEQDDERQKELSVTKKAWKLYAKYEDNRDILISIIALVNGTKVSETSTLEFIQGQVENIVDTKTKEFVKLCEDVDFETKQLIALAERAGILIRKSGKYETIDGLALARKGEVATLRNAVKYLNDPMNAEVVDLIKARLNNTKD